MPAQENRKYRRNEIVEGFFAAVINIWQQGQFLTKPLAVGAENSLHFLKLFSGAEAVLYAWQRQNDSGAGFRPTSGLTLQTAPE